MEEILRFASIFSLDLSLEEVEEIGEEMYGNTYPSELDRTFRKGEIGAWKEHYDEENLKLFNIRYGTYQTALGYFP